LRKVESLSQGENYSFSNEVTAKHNVDRFTLSRRHHDVPTPRAAKDFRQVKLDPQ
jgi:hypothetical protein